MGFLRVWLRLRNPPILLLSLLLPGPGKMGTWQGQSERRWTVILSKLSRGQAQCEVPTHAPSHPTAAVMAKQGAGQSGSGRSKPEGGQGCPCSPVTVSEWHL